MHRIDTSNASPTIPTPEAVGPNPDGFFTEGNPAGGTPATQVKADWLNSVQEELSEIIETAGLTLDKTNNTQLKNAIPVLFRKDTGVYVVDSGAANAYVVTQSPAPSSYTNGMRVSVKITNANTTASTINVNSLGLKTIKTGDGNDLTTGDLVAGMIAELRYDGTYFQLLNSSGGWAKKTQIQSGTLIYSASASAANTYTATPSPALTAYTTGMAIRINFTNGNTGAATINLNGLGAKSIKRDDGSTLISGDIPASTIVDMVYDGTNFRLQGLKNSQFLSSIAASGYQKFPSGLIMQWFTVVVPLVIGSTLATQAISFPIVFPNSPFFIVGNYVGAAGVTRGQIIEAHTWTASGFTGDFSATAAQPFNGTSTDVCFMAMGY